MKTFFSSNNITTIPGSKGNAAALKFLALLAKEITAEISAGEKIHHIILDVEEIFDGSVSGDLTLVYRKTAPFFKSLSFTEGHFGIKDRQFPLEDKTDILQILQPPVGW